MSTSRLLWSVTTGTSPILATAIHHGHHVRDEVSVALAVDAATRLREEDPYTGELTTISDNRLVVHRSRFEMDLNRNRTHAVYLNPEDAWGIKVWHQPFNPAMIRRSLVQYDAFYRALDELLTAMRRRHDKVVVLDFHSYNHHRQGPTKPFDSPAANPEIEIGTNTMDRAYWCNLVDGLITDLQQYRFGGRRLDVRENAKFGQGWMCQWINERYPMSVCAISIELKKTFMDEWTGRLNGPVLSAYRKAFLSVLPGLCDRLADWKESRARRVKDD
ncbi:MAG: N-formylglutamate amidohydrolase [Deltaproteobacteria bacterium]|nr:N-formylglutamate amidohydrolase [Deltaproteobacteria bacterium]